ncbi:hypothetical protein HanPSC8_Chr09g0365061 [Helianthus annuus]|nr:hypothetical protein HanPSC8_Chr09g0365061 [Helianthus annuus]
MLEKCSTRKSSFWIKSASKSFIKTLEQSAKEEENLEIPIPTSDGASS